MSQFDEVIAACKTQMTSCGIDCDEALLKAITQCQASPDRQGSWAIDLRFGWEIGGCHSSRRDRDGQNQFHCWETGCGGRCG